MARNFARVSTAVWADPTWRALGAGRQHMYLLLLSQPKLTLAGSLDVKTRVWADMAELPESDIVERLQGLDVLGLIAVDWETEELVIRTFVRHDLVLSNRKTAKGMWSAWGAIESQRLREVVVANLPSEAFDPDVDPPIEPPIEPPIDHPILGAGDGGSEDSGSTDRSSRALAVAEAVTTPPTPPRPVDNLGAVS